MRTRRTLINEAIERLESAGIANPTRNAEWMLCDVLECSKASLYADAADGVSQEVSLAFESMLDRRVRHEPLQYILGYTDFYGLRLAVTPDVLIPRPETEQVVEHALSLISELSSPRVLDTGTGSGCIAIALKAQRDDAIVAACDVSPSALEVARANASAHGLQIDFGQADALATDFASNVPSRLDLLISNPPYVAESELDSLPQDVREHEPKLALVAPHHPLVFYRKLSEDGQKLLTPGGWIVFETHADFGGDAEEVLKNAGYEQVELKSDYAGRSRILSGRQPG